MRVTANVELFNLCMMAKSALSDKNMSTLSPIWSFPYAWPQHGVFSARRPAAESAPILFNHRSQRKHLENFFLIQEHQQQQPSWAKPKKKKTGV
jgi:hypothetical protein